MESQEPVGSAEGQCEGKNTVRSDGRIGGWQVRVGPDLHEEGICV